MDKCPICGAAHKMTFSSNFAVVQQCSNNKCGHLFAIQSFPGRGVHEHDSSNIGLYARRNERLIRRLIKERVLPTEGRVLDIGAGLGHIVMELKRQAPLVHIVCVEAAPESVKILRRNGLTVVEDLDALTQDTYGLFDAILLVEVIEHVEDPVGLLRRCKRMLRSGGTIFLTTPSGKLSYVSKQTAAYDIPEHVHFFTRTSLVMAAQSANFTNVRFRELREYHAGPRAAALKWLKDTARICRNLIDGKHHFIATLR
jgi:SAM-dependent methyltransferase